MDVQVADLKLYLHQANNLVLQKKEGYHICGRRGGESQGTAEGAGAPYQRGDALSGRKDPGGSARRGSDPHRGQIFRDPGSGPYGG